MAVVALEPGAPQWPPPWQHPPAKPPTPFRMVKTPVVIFMFWMLAARTAKALQELPPRSLVRRPLTALWAANLACALVAAVLDIAPMRRHLKRLLKGVLMVNILVQLHNLVVGLFIFLYLYDGWQFSEALQSFFWLAIATTALRSNWMGIPRGPVQHDWDQHRPPPPPPFAGRPPF